MPLLKKADAHETLGVDQEKVRILNVEDSQSDARILKRLLADAHDGDRYEITHVERLRDGFKKLQDETFDLAILDLSLPDSQGLETLKLFRESFGTLPVVVLTGLDDRAVGPAALSCGAMDYLVKGALGSERISHTINFAIHRHRFLLSQQAGEVDEDPDTKLATKHVFQIQLEQILATAKRESKRFALITIFSKDLGTDSDLAKKLAEGIRHHKRDQDIAARLSPEKFIVVKNDVTAPETVATLAFQLRECLAGHASSFGVSIFPTDGDTSEKLLSDSEMAMLRAKESGAQQIRFAFPGANMRVEAFAKLTHELEAAGESEAFIIHYQPSISLQTFEVANSQVLVRWDHPKLGVLFAQDFVSVAENAGLIASLNEWLIRRAARQLKEWSATPQGFQQLLTLPLAPTQFEDLKLLNLLPCIFKREDVSPSLLGFEFTEAALMTDFKRNLEFLNELRSLGVQLILDSVGSGATSLSLIEKLPISGIKLDRSMIRSIDTDKRVAGRVQALIIWAHSLDLQVTAEGIENAAQCSLLRELECDLGQGYFICRPLGSDEFSKAVEELNYRKIQ